MTEYERLTGFKPKGKAPYRVLLDYGYAHWVEHCGAMTHDRARAQVAKLRQWPSDKVRILNLNQ